jgi:hypothetical protein
LSKQIKIDTSLVDIDATIEKFGYDPRNFTFGLRRKVIVNCCFCSEQIEAWFDYLAQRNFRKSCGKCRNKMGAETKLKCVT